MAGVRLAAQVERAVPVPKENNAPAERWRRHHNQRAASWLRRSSGPSRSRKKTKPVILERIRRLSDCAARGANIPLDFRTFLQWTSREGTG